MVSRMVLSMRKIIFGSFVVKYKSRGAVAQLVRVPHCHCGGRGFESLQPRSLVSIFAEANVRVSRLILRMVGISVPSTFSLAKYFLLLPH